MGHPGEEPAGFRFLRPGTASARNSLSPLTWNQWRPELDFPTRPEVDCGALENAGFDREVGGDELWNR
jgi:hypothetical protein